MAGVAVIAVVVLYLAGILVFAARTRHRNRIARLYHREPMVWWYDTGAAIVWPGWALLAIGVFVVSRAARLEIGGWK